MPLYEFECPECHLVFEKIKPYTVNYGFTECERCGKGVIAVRRPSIGDTRTQTSVTGPTRGKHVPATTVSSRPTNPTASQGIDTPRQMGCFNLDNADGSIVKDCIFFNNAIPAISVTNSSNVLVDGLISFSNSGGVIVAHSSQLTIERLQAD